MKATTLRFEHAVLSALLALASTPYCESIEQDQLGICNAVIDFESIVVGPQSNPLVISGLTFHSATTLSVDPIAPFAAGFPELLLGNVLSTVPGLLASTHVPITIEFPAPVSEIGLGWWDPNSQGNFLQAFDASGNLLEEVAPDLFSTGGCCADFVGIRRPQADIASVVVRNANVGDYYAIDFLSYGVGQAALETERVGTPANPAALLPGVTSGPAVGKLWDPVIDHSTFLPNAQLDLVVVTPNAGNAPLGSLGTLLCDPSVIFAQPTSAPGIPFAIPIPADCSLVGRTLCSQGASLAPQGVQLTNALDLSLGTY